VQRIAHNMVTTMPPNVEVGDMIQAGLEGLMHAQKTFKPATGVPFEAYAVIKIRWYIMDELRRQDWLPKSLRTKRKALDEATRRATADSETGKVSEEQIAAALDINIDAYHKMLLEVSNAQVVYYEDFDMEGENNSFLDSIADDGASSPEVSAEASQIRAMLSRAIEQLPEREALILSLYYEEELTYREIADVVEVSIPRVHQLHAQAISKVRALSGLVGSNAN
jgi:RNA polymerase sigma factor for flagellar operon FliA